jgi:hypothetical protein
MYGYMGLLKLPGYYDFELKFRCEKHFFNIVGEKEGLVATI